MTWTADDLVAAVRVRAQLPAVAGDGAMTDADILTLANEEISLRLVPLVRRSRGDYFVSIYDVPIVTGTGAYRVPERAQTSGLREVTILDSSGREWPVPQMHLEDAGPAQIYGGGWDAVRFYMRGPDVVLVPTPTYPDCTLRMYYHRSHPTLVPNAQSGTVFRFGSNLLGVATATEAAGVVYYAVPSTWDELWSLDLFHVAPPFGVVAMDLVIESRDDSDLPSSYTYTMVDALPDTVESLVLHMASQSGQTSIVDLPRECWPLLVSAVTARVCEVIGDRDAAALAYGLYDRESANIMTLLAPRVEGNKQVIVDRFSTLRSGRGGMRGGWR